MNIRQLTLIGVGLIGGSFALDLKRQGLVESVVGIDTNQDNLERALERNVIDCAANTIDESVSASDLVILATPVGQMATIAQQLIPYLHQDTIISDVGSTKENVLEIFRKYLPQHFPNCVAAHPIAGSDRSGAIAAQFGLFRDKKVILCPHSKQNSEALQTIRALWQTTGAEVFELSGQDHDKIFASVSHLPHLLAFTFVNQLGKQEDANACLTFAGSGFKDFTRIASSQPNMWADIALANQATLNMLLEKQKEEITLLQQLVQEGNNAKLTEYFTQAKTIRDFWLKKQSSS